MVFWARAGALSAPATKGNPMKTRARRLAVDPVRQPVEQFGPADEVAAVRLLLLADLGQFHLGITRRRGDDHGLTLPCG